MINLEKIWSIIPEEDKVYIGASICHELPCSECPIKKKCQRPGIGGGIKDALALAEWAMKEAE